MPNGGLGGVRFDQGAGGNTIGGTAVGEGNLISGNTSAFGIVLLDTGGPNNAIQGNHIGIDVNGGALPNKDGIDLQASNSAIGGTAPGAGNVISGNTRWGMLVRSGEDNQIQGNLIGTNAAGTSAVGNQVGILLNGAPNNTIGGTVPGARNIVSGNSSIGVHINGAASSGNVVLGNYIGTDVTGTADLGNGFHGVAIQDAPGNTIGGTTAEARNIISGNSHGVAIIGGLATGNLVQGNYIGTDVTGTVDLGHIGDGVLINNAPNNTIGGTTPGARNIISGNATGGNLTNNISIIGSGATENVVQGNYIGTDVTGTVALNNTANGVSISNAPDNTIGGTIPGARNIISGNQAGVGLGGSGATGNVVQGNFIGTDVTGTSALGNAFDGVSIASSASNNTIGGTTAGERNIISGNNSDGIQITSGATGNFILGNFIGTDVNGTSDLGNSGVGVYVLATPGNAIGGTAPGAGNLISGNNSYGIIIDGNVAAGNTVEGNFIGTDVTGSDAVGNTLSGVLIRQAPDNTVGGTTPGARNLISGNSQKGVWILFSGATDNLVQGNFIGTDVNGTADLGNGQQGVQINAASNNTIGGTTPEARNIISGNDLSGVGFQNGATSNLVQGNYIGTDVGGTAALGNTRHGAFIVQSASDNTIGGTAGGAGNTLAYNGEDGVFVATGTGNAVLSNVIRSNAGLGIDLGADGVTANDGNDGDTGANNQQNYPVLTAVTPGSITGSLNSTSNTTFRIEFFSNSACDLSGFGEGETFLGATDVTTDGSGNASFTAALSVGNGQFVAGTATDPGNNTSEFSACFQAPTNQPPVVAADQSPAIVDEGQAAANTGTVSDPDGDTVTLMASVGTVSNNGNGTWSWSFPTNDGPAQSQTVNIDADDGNGGTANATFALTVNNVAPTVDAITVPIDPVDISDQPVSASATFSDPAGASDDPYTCTVNYGDGTGDQPGTVTSSTSCTGPDHTYADPGVYTVIVTVTDKDGDSGSAQATDFIVIYDPSAGFVTGGGWIDSPPGAYTADPTLTGKANFGFVSKYKKGQSTPTGQTEFQFKAGDLNFHSSSYDWLVIAGAKAMYKGVGTIDGAGSYDFQINAIDGQVNGGGGVDKFRIKIKDDGGGGIIYDNQPGAGDNDDPTTALGGGSIKIHKGNNAKPIGAVPSQYALDQNVPNPFNPTTQIAYELVEAGETSLLIYNVLGQPIRTLVRGHQKMGAYAVTWDGKDDNGQTVSNGLYLYRLVSGEFVQSRRMLLLK